MTKGIITLSHAELDRVSVIRSIISRRLTQAQAAQRLKPSIRQVKRLTRAYRTCGAAGMASKRRGRCPGNAIGDTVRRQAFHRSRPRRPRLGEPVQIDGSPHDWFEGRGPRCTLIVFIDDATSRLLTLRFAPSRPWTSRLFTPTPRRQKGV